MKPESGEVLRTYKAGLKLPASLLSPFTQLVREREMLQFLLKSSTAQLSKKQAQQLHKVAANYKHPATQKWKCFLAHKNLLQTSEASRSKYKELFTKYADCPLPDLGGLLQVNQQKLAFFTRTELLYDATLHLRGAD